MSLGLGRDRSERDVSASSTARPEGPRHVRPTNQPLIP